MDSQIETKFLVSVNVNGQFHLSESFGCLPSAQGLALFRSGFEGQLSDRPNLPE